jgi:hypothetical protein
MSKILKNKKIIVVFFLVNSFILNLAVGTISNYSATIFILKLVSSILLFLLIFIDIRINRIDIHKFTKGKQPQEISYYPDPVYRLLKHYANLFSQSWLWFPKDNKFSHKYHPIHFCILLFNYNKQ